MLYNNEFTATDLFCADTPSRLMRGNTTNEERERLVNRADAMFCEVMGVENLKKPAKSEKVRVS